MVGPYVALIDVDAFKSINDTFSHQSGDRVLVALAQIFVAQSRAEDLVGRLAGDEFVIIFAPSEMENGQPACARIQDAVASHTWNEIATGLRVSVSIGIAKAHAGEPMEAVLHRSDLAMYEAKAAASHTLRVAAADETSGAGRRGI
jgi:diguanylate cyclase (GGDEF)-like protein